MNFRLVFIGAFFSFVLNGSKLNVNAFNPQEIRFLASENRLIEAVEKTLKTQTLKELAEGVDAMLEGLSLSLQRSNESNLTEESLENLYTLMKLAWEGKLFDLNKFRNLDMLFYKNYNGLTGIRILSYYSAKAVQFIFGELIKKKGEEYYCYLTDKNKVVSYIELNDYGSYLKERTFNLESWLPYVRVSTNSFKWLQYLESHRSLSLFQSYLDQVCNNKPERITHENWLIGLQN